MEVLVVVAMDRASLHIDAVLQALQAAARASTGELDILDHLPEVVSRKLMSAENLASVLYESVVPTPTLPSEPDAMCNSRTPNAPPVSARGSDTDPSVLLLKRIAKRDKKIKLLIVEMDTLRQNLHVAVQRVKNLEMEQEQFFEDVQELKNQYDKLSQHHQKIMWEYLPSRDADLTAIPLLAKQTQESPTCIGKYPLQDVLGYGQYATVYASSTPEEKEPLAIKVIDKDKLIDLVALLRVNSEISSLCDPNIVHPGILAIKDVIHTNRFIYLVTERGGKDLFDHFGVRQDGLGEDVIKPLMFRVAQAVQILHRHNYCHRDLKPENILYNPDGASDKLVKLIDFGLCTKAVTAQDHMLRDFCGSPGFFAPEILLSESYDGMKADVWSLGSILLELVIGNTMFVTLWMNMYELEVLKDRASFSEFVKLGLTQVYEHCQGPKWVHSSKLRHLLFGMLCEEPSERLSIHQMLDHPWFHSSSGSGGASNSNSVSPFTTGNAPTSPRGSVLVRHVSQLDESPAAVTPSTAAAVTPLSGRSSTKVKSHSTSSASTLSPFVTGGGNGTRSGSLGIASVVARPLSAEHEGPASALSQQSPRAARAPVVTVKVSLPSLSPEKPSGNRSPERAFAKRSSNGSSHHHHTSAE